MSKKLIYKNGSVINGTIVGKNNNIVEVELDQGGFMYLEATSVKEVEDTPVEKTPKKAKTKKK